jgi:hypothetical protein
LDSIDLFKRVKAALLGSLEEDLRRTIQEDEAVGEEKVKSIQVKGWGAGLLGAGAEKWKRRIRNIKQSRRLLVYWSLDIGEIG